MLTKCQDLYSVLKYDITPHPQFKKRKRHFNFAACLFVFSLVVCRALLQTNTFDSVFFVMAE